MSNTLLGNLAYIIPSITTIDSKIVLLAGIWCLVGQQICCLDRTAENSVKEVTLINILITR